MKVESQLHNAWIANRTTRTQVRTHSMRFIDELSLPFHLAKGDGIAIVHQQEERILIESFARIYQVRTSSKGTTIYFDSFVQLPHPKDAGTNDWTVLLNETPIARLDWIRFETILNQFADIEFSSMPPITGFSLDEQDSLRELLLNAVAADLHGPASGPDEEIVGMSVRDRYLVGKLAPKIGLTEENIEGLKGPMALNEDVESPPEDLRPLEEDGIGKGKGARRYLPGEEFATAKGSTDPDDDESDEVEASKNQSIVPSSFGLTVCLEGSAEEIEIEALWGRYVRTSSEEQTSEEGKPLRAWKRIPSGGKTILRIEEGLIDPFPPDPECPKVLIQGTIRAKSDSGERLVTLFLVNDQEKPQTNQDEAWLFQPEMILRDPGNEPIFRRRPIYDLSDHDPERISLEMIYRNRVEFAVGHGVSVHAEVSDEAPDLAIEVRTSVLPQHEVAITETPGSDLEDRPAMRRLVQDELLDMQSLADMDEEKLITTLDILVDDYQLWIEEQRSRIGRDVVGYDDSAKQALNSCEEVLARLREGVSKLQKVPEALESFRFANRAMAMQRVHSILAQKMRRGEDAVLEALDVPRNRSWRPFQLAFILLSIPALADPKHPDRTNPVDAIADLLWFPTGGGKTEAYLGVAAFTMAIRRLQGNLGGLDASRGLSVIMRYTLRLLTVQQFQRASTLLCAMEVIRRQDVDIWGQEPFTLGLWVGQRVTPNHTEASHSAIEAIRTGQRPRGSSPAQLSSCPWCGEEIKAGRDILVKRVGSDIGRTIIYCGDKHSECEFSKAKSPEIGIPVSVVDEEIYRRPPSMLIATVDKFALMAWRGETRHLFGHASRECPRHGLVWPESKCKESHRRSGSLPAVKITDIDPIRPPDLIIQDELHLISGPLGTMVGLYETAVDGLATWELDGKSIKTKVIASTATIRKALSQVNDLFLRRVSIFPPHGLDIGDDFFSVERPITSRPGRRYLGICAPGSARPAVLIRVYTALLTAAQELFEHFGPAADPWMTVVGYFNSLRELGGMKRLSEDDVQTRSFRVNMSKVARPGLAQRSVKKVDELTSRVPSKDIPTKLDQLEIPFRGEIDPETGRYKTAWESGEDRSMDIVLATNMLGVGVDIFRLGLMVVNGQPKSTAEYIQATSRIGRFFPGLVCTVLTWSRPRDLSHFETFEHYHATFYKHVEAQSVTPFAPRALDRGLTGAMVGWLRLSHDEFNPNLGAEKLDSPNRPEIGEMKKLVAERAGRVTDAPDIQALVASMVDERCDEWIAEASFEGRKLGYESGRKQGDVAPLLNKPGARAWTRFTVPFSLREVEPGVRLILDSKGLGTGPSWMARPPEKETEGEHE